MYTAQVETVTSGKQPSAFMTPRLVAISDRKAWPMESASGRVWNSPKNRRKDGFLDWRIILTCMLEKKKNIYIYICAVVL